MEQEALETIHNPNVSNEIRIEAQKFCNFVKDDFMAPSYGQILAGKNNQQPDFVRYFGLQLIENSIKFKWNDETYNDKEREKIKKGVIELVNEGIDNIFVEKLFIKEKIANLFANIIKIELTDNLFEMDNLAQSYYFSEPIKQELMLIAYRYLAEDLDIRDSLISLISSFNTLKKQYPHGVKNESNQQGKLTIMYSDTNNEGWLIRWTRSLNQLMINFQNQAAIECLLVIVSRNFQNPEDRAIVLEPLLDGNLIELLFSSYRRLQPILLDEKEYDYTKKFVETLVVLGDKHICFKNNGSLPKQFQRYLELLYEISKHSSNFIASLTMIFWNSALRHPFISKTFNEQESLLLMLLELFSNRALLLMQPDDVNNEIVYYNELEFDTIKEYHNFAQPIRTKCIEAIKLVVQIIPIQSFNWMFNRIQPFFNINPNQNDLDESGVCKMDSLLYIKFDLEMTIMESILSCIGTFVKKDCDKNNDDTELLRDQIVNEMRNLLKILLDIENLIFKYIIFCPEGFHLSAKTSMPSAISRLRSGAMTTLIKLGAAIPDILMISLQQKQVIFDSIVESTISEIHSKKIKSFLSNISEFCEASGLVLLSSVVNDMKLKGMFSFNSILEEGFFESFEDCRVRTTKTGNDSSKIIPELNLWEKYIPIIATSILSLIRNIHYLWNTELWENIPAELQRILVPSDEEKASYLGFQQKSNPTNDDHSKQYTIVGMIERLHKWLYNIRIDCYRILGCLTFFEPFYSIPNIHELIATSLFENAKYPYVMNCQTPEILSNVLPQLIKHLDQKLVNEWSILIEKGIQISPQEETIKLFGDVLKMSNEFEEILNEKLLRDLTRAFIDFFESILIEKSKKNPNVSLCHLITFEDMISCSRAVQLCNKMIKSLIQNESLRNFVGRELLISALQALNDGHQKENHSLIIALITEIYLSLRPISSVPYETFGQILNLDHVKLQDFEASLVQGIDLKEQRNTVKKFLGGFTGLSKNDLFKEVTMTVKSSSSSHRTIIGDYIKPKLNVLDIIDDSNESTTGLKELIKLSQILEYGAAIGTKKTTISKLGEQKFLIYTSIIRRKAARAVFTVWTFIWFLQHVWNIDRFKALKWRRIKKFELKSAITILLLLMLPLQAFYDISSSVIKYREGFFLNPLNGEIVSKPHTFWSEENKALMLSTDYILCASFSVQTCLLFLLQSFWNYLANNLAKTTFMGSFEFKSYIVYSIFSISIFPILQYVFRESNLLTEVVPQLTYSIFMILICILGIRSHWRFTKLLRVTKNSSTARTSIVSKLTYFRDMNRYLTLALFIGSISLATLSIDGLTSAKWLNSHKLSSDLLICHLNFSIWIVFVTLILIFYPSTSTTNDQIQSTTKASTSATATASSSSSSSNKILMKNEKSLNPSKWIPKSYTASEEDCVKLKHSPSPWSSQQSRSANDVVNSSYYIDINDDSTLKKCIKQIRSDSLDVISPPPITPPNVSKPYQQSPLNPKRSDKPESLKTSLPPITIRARSGSSSNVIESNNIRKSAINRNRSNSTNTLNNSNSTLIGGGTRRIPGSASSTKGNTGSRGGDGVKGINTLGRSRSSSNSSASSSGSILKKKVIKPTRDTVL
ncbi:2440_t:CDS:10, partial [Entrophospora sp. SA101]